MICGSINLQLPITGRFQFCSWGELILTRPDAQKKNPGIVAISYAV